MIIKFVCNVCSDTRIGRVDGSDGKSDFIVPGLCNECYDSIRQREIDDLADRTAEEYHDGKD